MLAVLLLAAPAVYWVFAIKFLARSDEPLIAVAVLVGVAIGTGMWDLTLLGLDEATGWDNRLFEQWGVYCGGLADKAGIDLKVEDCHP